MTATQTKPIVIRGDVQPGESMADAMMRLYREAQVPTDIWEAAKRAHDADALQSAFKLYDHIYDDPKAAYENCALESLRYNLLSACANLGTVEGFTAAFVGHCDDCRIARAKYLFGCLVAPNQKDPVH